MSTPVKVAGFFAALAAVFGIAMGVGNAVGPVAEPPTAHDPEHQSEASPDAHGRAGATPAATATPPGGLMTSQSGYTLRLADPQLPPGQASPVKFMITGADGDAVTEYDVEHEKQLHLIAVRRDFTGFQHVHPELAPDGTWTTRLDLTPGQWRLFADFKATGADALTLGTDLAVAGRYEPAPASGEVRTAEVDGYTVTLAGDLAPGSDARLTLEVSRDGRPVTDLQPYLGAYGHLVALRDGDLAYLHVHPDGSPGDGTTEPGPEVVFYAAVPSDGTYRLFLDFQHQGVVRTAAFALSTDGAAPTASRSEDGSESEDAQHGSGQHDH
jgi:hypothetical protein